jgi:predicted phosphodiesterase
MREPLRILSDLHLGHQVSRVARVEALRPLLAGIATVVFNGDTWQELAAPFRERSAALLEELRALCRSEGAEPVFLPGNHDPGWPGPGWLEWAGGRIVATHGDALYFDSSPWSREAMARQRLVAERWAAHPDAARDAAERHQLVRELARAFAPPKYSRGRNLWQRAWDAAHPPGRALRMIDAWTGQASTGARFCERYFPRAEVLLIGHFHWPGAWSSRGRLVINTGAWMNPCRAWCVDWHDGLLRRRRIDEGPRECRPGPPVDTWRLPPADDRV